MLLAGVLAGSLGAPLGASAAPYAGPVKTASASFAVKGLDGATYTLDLSVVVPGYLLDDEAQLTVRTSRCTRGGCAAPSSFTRTLHAKEYADRLDLNVITVAVKMGTLELAAEWYAPPGFGKGHGPTTDGGPAVHSRATADAVLMIGAYGRYARCVQPRATVEWRAGVLTEGYRRSDSWPAQEPAGLRLKKKSTRRLSCVAT